jgi:Kef-type K+ transport system membrane component KefB
MEAVLPIVGVLFCVYVLARAFGEIAERLHLPALVGEIAAGVVIANLAFGSFHLVAWLSLDPASAAGALNREILTALVEIGVIFLVFAVGLEIRPSQLRAILPVSARTAFFGLLVPFALGATFLLAVQGPGSALAALFVGTTLVVTSLTVTARFLRERDLLASTEARVILGAAVIEDVVGVVLLTFVLGVAADRGTGAADLVFQVALVSAFAVAFVAFFLYVAPHLVRRYVDPARPGSAIARFRTRSVTLALAIALCLGASALAASFQLASILGALFVGMAFAEYRDRLGLASAFEALNTFFVPFFFVGIGLLVSGGDLAATWPLASALTVLAVAGKLAGAFVESRHLGRPAALRVGVGMIPRGEVGIIAALAGLDAGVISGDLYTALVLMAVATSVIGPLGLARLFRPPARGAPTTPDVSSTGT